jgi:hypothetical protein
MQSIESIKDILDKAGCAPEYFKFDDIQFSRNIRFWAWGVECFIEWWANVAYLSLGTRYSSCFPFTGIRINTTWPSFKEGLEFYAAGAGRMFVVTKPLDWQKEIR